MIRDTLSRDAAQRFYDRLGAYHDRAELYEGRAKARALELLDLTPGQRVLNVGVGTGKEHARLQAAVAPDGIAFGLDISRVMLHLTHQRTGAPLCQADARQLPFVPDSFDCLFASYVLDLIATADLPCLLAEFRRVLKPEGRMALVALTEGVNLPSHALIAIWKLAYSCSPVICGGCRPIRLSGLVEHAGFKLGAREVVVQWGVPSEVLVAMR